MDIIISLLLALNSRQVEYSDNSFVQSIIIILFLLFITILLIIQIYVRLKVNKKLEAANEVKSKLFLILNHDMRRPIASLTAYMTLKKENHDIPEDELKKMDDEAFVLLEKTLNSMDDLIIWSKNQMHSFYLDRKMLAISDVFADIESFFGHEKRVSFRFENPDKLSLKTDANCLKTIMRNLTSNSIKKALEVEETTIIWKAYKVNKNTVLSIQNFGSQIEKEYVDILFSYSKNKLSTTGTGLVIVRDLAKAIKCKIDVETGEEIGTIFRLIF
ncbi:HAMP domain-containing histidine kinase [Bacteroidales bacterium OttesenSCG-928-I14]|nr:HAMP domain-containing histidine kinase [Bacteroidales bacterium OttesenSCG-928-I14]